MTAGVSGGTGDGPRGGSWDGGPDGAHDVRRAVVVGGGMAGLVAAYQLTLDGHRPLVLEATGAVGGSVARHTVAGVELDAGADSFAVNRPSVTALLTDLGMSGRLVQPSGLGAWVRHQAGSAPLPTAALLGIPGRPAAADVRAVIGWPGAVRAWLDAVLPAGYGGPTLGTLVRRRMGRRVLRRLVEPVVGGVHAADPWLLELDAVAPGLSAALSSTGSLARGVRQLRGNTSPAGSAVAGIRGGMASLPEALTAAIYQAGGRIRCDTAVSGVRRSDGEWQVQHPGGALSADLLVLAVPAADCRELLEPVLGPGAFPIDAGIASTSVTLVTLVIDDHRLDAAPRGSGVLVAPGVDGLQAKALTHATAKWEWLAASLPPGRHVLRLSYGRGGFDRGARADAGPNPDGTPADRNLPAIALTDASTLLGVRLREPDVLGSAVVRWPSALPQARAGHAEAVQRLRTAVAAQPGLAVIGSALAGNGLAAVVDDARERARLLASQSTRRASGS